MKNTKFIDLTGKRSGRLLIVDRAENGKRGQPRWNCICNCGNKTIVYGAPLRAGMHPDRYSGTIHSSRSCGCLQKEIAHRVLLAVNTKHGQSKSHRYEMWCSAKKRAEKAHVLFNLDFSEFPEIPETCPVLGIPLQFNHQSGPCANSPTLDRIVPALGYVKGNIKVISHRANTIKSDATEAEILAVAKYVYDNTDPVCVVH